jgi:hypothetical protein
MLLLSSSPWPVEFDSHLNGPFSKQVGTVQTVLFTSNKIEKTKYTCMLIYIHKLPFFFIIFHL